MSLLFILISSTLISAISSNLEKIYTEVETSPDKIEAYRLASNFGHANSSDSFELYLKVPLEDEELNYILSMQQYDGHWSDIDYNDTKRSGWEPLQHALRVARLSIRYYRTKDLVSLDVAKKAIRWWGENKPICKNWWYNQIGIPRQFCIAAILLWNELDSQEKGALSYILNHSSIRQTGQNRVWQAGNVLIRGILENDEILVVEARNTILEELKFNHGGEGLQKDWSFHQHGPQLQFGNYGLSFALSQSFWARAFSGTKLSLTRKQRSILTTYINKGLGRVVWRGYFDLSASGRQVFKNEQRGKALCVEQACRNLNILEGSLRGATYYPSSDFGIYRQKQWYASIRMQSPRIIPYETTNKENLQGWFSSDGALLVRVMGDEYNNISAVWNWRRIPGVTSWDNGKKPWGPLSKKDSSQKTNLENYVGGKVDNHVMTTYMAYNRGGLKAQKAWFFFEDGIVCLGAGITMDEEEISRGTTQVVTTIEQNLLLGEVQKSASYLYHRGIFYISLDGQKIISNVSKHEGCWKDIAHFYSDKDYDKKDIFEAWFNHGPKPKNASYAYVVIPAQKSVQEALKISQRVQVVENTQKEMIVRIDGRRYKVSF
ncbi:MAG: hypothetical protein KBS95_03775 [Alistipes sp.]|nr:hypothetical protein [Candidatus Alistipes equi]